MGIDKSGVEFVNQLQNLCNGYQVWKTDNTNKKTYKHKTKTSKKTTKK